MDDKYANAQAIILSIETSPLLTKLEEAGIGFVVDGINADFFVSFHLEDSDEKGEIRGLGGFEALANHYIENKDFYKRGGDIKQVGPAVEKKEEAKRQKELSKFHIENGLIKGRKE
jgi:hypothetical protein